MSWGTRRDSTDNFSYRCGRSCRRSALRRRSSLYTTSTAAGPAGTSLPASTTLAPDLLRPRPEALGLYKTLTQPPSSPSEFTILPIPYSLSPSSALPEAHGLLFAHTTNIAFRVSRLIPMFTLMFFFLFFFRSVPSSAPSGGSWSLQNAHTVYIVIFQWFSSLSWRYCHYLVCSIVFLLCTNHSSFYFSLALNLHWYIFFLLQVLSPPRVYSTLCWSVTLSFIPLNFASHYVPFSLAFKFHTTIFFLMSVFSLCFVCQCQ